MLTVATLLLVLLPPVASAQGDPYAADSLRLVPFADTVQEVYSQGVDTWEVWQCHVPGWSDTFDVPSVVDNLNSVVTSYFEWLSDDRYRPTFTAGGDVTSNDVVPADINSQEAFRVPGCEAAVAAATSGTAGGALIVVAGGFNEGYGTAGAICPEDPFTGCVDTYPENLRIAVVGAAAVTAVDPFAGPQYVTVAHEIGHSLNWGHSYSGKTILSNGTVDQYDNPMDVMSGETIQGLPVGTIAYNRYAAGWIDPGQVVVHHSGTQTYELTPVGSPGTQMVVIPTADEGHFYTLDVRRLASFDSTLPQAGVEIYEVDQRRSACSMPDAWPATWPCFATLIRITQTPAVAGATSTAHVLSIDEWVDLGQLRVEVLGANTDSFSVLVTDERTGQRFIDDDGNLHEANIEAIAALGITEGCNPPLDDRYCPTRPVSRAEMAAFLVRAIGDENNLPTYQGYFPDVPPDAWYAGYVERLYDLGIVTGYLDGTYRPATNVNRGEMAAFLVRAFGHTTELTDPVGLFSDVDPAAWYAPDAELIYNLGITTGCSTSPLRYCPDTDVLRDQMASFLARALGIGN